MDYCDIFERQKNCHNILYEYQKVSVGGDLAGRYSDIYRVFAERNVQLLAHEGFAGFLAPSAFHANEGATGIRRLYLENANLQICYSFENRRKLFDIDSRFKFALIVARKGGTTADFRCAYYLHDDEWLFGHRDSSRLLRYSTDFVRQTGGEYLSFAELRSAADVEALSQIVHNGRLLGDLETGSHMVFRTEPIAFNVTSHGALFTSTAKALPHAVDVRHGSDNSDLLRSGYYVLQEGKYLNQFTDLWESCPRYSVQVQHAGQHAASIPNARYFRLAFRTIASSTNERTAVFTVLPPGAMVTNSVGIEASPEARPNNLMLATCGYVNSYCFDFTVRVKGGANMNLFIMRSGIIPVHAPKTFIAHCVLRLVANHSTYAPLWAEQLNNAWRESSKDALCWPALQGDQERWAVRAAIDALVADAFALSRDQYEHVLNTFSHSSYPSAPTLCLARFDELKQIGLEAFARKYDPYWDVSLNEKLPDPVFDLPIAGEEAADEPSFKLTAPAFDAGRTTRRH